MQLGPADAKLGEARGARCPRKLGSARFGDSGRAASRSHDIRRCTFRCFGLQTPLQPYLASTLFCPLGCLLSSCRPPGHCGRFVMGWQPRCIQGREKMPIQRPHCFGAEFQTCGSEGFDGIRCLSFFVFLSSGLKMLCHCLPRRSGATSTSVYRISL